MKKTSKTMMLISDKILQVYIYGMYVPVDVIYLGKYIVYLSLTCLMTKRRNSVYNILLIVPCDQTNCPICLLDKNM